MIDDRGDDLGKILKKSKAEPSMRPCCVMLGAPISTRQVFAVITGGSVRQLSRRYRRTFATHNDSYTKGRRIGHGGGGMSIVE